MNTVATTLLTDRYMYLPERRITPAPDATFTGGITGVIDRFAAMLARGDLAEGALIIDPYAAARLDLPQNREQLGADHPAAEALRAAGWRVSGITEWTIIWAPNRPIVHMGIYRVIEPDRSPVILPEYSDTVEACERWRRLIGTVYHGTPGVAGISSIRELATAGARTKTPTWQPKETGPGDGYELTYELPGHEGGWRGVAPAADHHWLHGYDSKRMYLPAMGSVGLCPWALKPTGADVEWEPGLAGWWLCEFAPWQDDRLPDPAGYARPDHEGPRWVTAPTLALLHELMDEGVHGGYVVKDSYTGPAKRVLRTWAERQRAAWQAPEVAVIPDAADLPIRHAVRDALKACYREAAGMLNAPASRVRRPDWHFAIIAQARSNLWRRIRKVGNESGRWPSLIDVDNVFYSAASDDAVAECPAGLVIGDQHGQFTIKDSRRIA